MRQFYKRQLYKLTGRTEIQVLISELDNERRIVKRKIGDLKALRNPGNPLKTKKDIEFLDRELIAWNTIRGLCITKISEIKTQEKINNDLSYDTIYAETFLQVATSVLNKKTFEKIQAIALNKLGDNSLATKKPAHTESKPRQQGNTQTLSLPERERKLKKE